ncbi:MAG: type IV pilus modification protein PilV [Gammaproteobacteria bacterium]|nr:type IV pilus modification protein PilV [Gammaproteobacteria bacterium]
MLLDKPTTRTPGLQRGFSLVEVLIALVILSVGMLGIAGLYVQSMQAGRTSMFRHNAVTLAGDVADRIRANPRAGIAYQGGGADNGCVGADCSELEMAAHDIMLWRAQADGTLPGGDVTVVFDDTVFPPEYTISVDWVEPGDPPEQSYSIVIPVLGI